MHECENIFEHECPDWDYLYISLLDGEAVGCSCYRGIPEADILYQQRAEELSTYNERYNTFTEAENSQG